MDKKISKNKVKQNNFWAYALGSSLILGLFLYLFPDIINVTIFFIKFLYSLFGIGVLDKPRTEAMILIVTAPLVAIAMTLWNLYKNWDYSINNGDVKNG